jgi:hypothetical protein
VTRKRRAAGPLVRDARRVRLASSPETSAYTVGELLVQRMPAGAPVENSFGFDGTYAERYQASRAAFAAMLERPPTARQVAQRYRAIDSGMDEWVNTSLMKSMFAGAVGELRRIPAADRDRVKAHLVEIFASLSAPRMSTAFVGYALGDAPDLFVQHPTAVHAAVNARSGAGHYQHDLLRRAVVMGAVENELTAASTSYDIAGTILRTALEYTLRYFAAPLSSADNLPNTRLFRERRDLRSFLDSDLRVRHHLEREAAKRALARNWPERVRPGERSARTRWRTGGVDTPMHVLGPVSDAPEALGRLHLRADRPASPERVVGSLSPERPSRGLQRSLSASELWKLLR